MSAVVKLSSKMPGDFETNGLDAIADQLLEAPKDLRCAVVWFDVKGIAEDVDTGDHIPTVRLRRFEPLGKADDVTTAIKAAVNEAIEKRTGRTPIPWDIVEVTEERYSDPLDGTAD